MKRISNSFITHINGSYTEQHHSPVLALLRELTNAYESALLSFLHKSVTPSRCGGFLGVLFSSCRFWATFYVRQNLAKAQSLHSPNCKVDLASFSKLLIASFMVDKGSSSSKIISSGLNVISIILVASMSKLHSVGRQLVTRGIEENFKNDIIAYPSKQLYHLRAARNTLTGCCLDCSAVTLSQPSKAGP